jgi:hypothetical protein
MRRILTVVTAIAMAATLTMPTLAAQDKEPPIVGQWQAAMETPHGKMELVFEFKFNAKEKKNITGTVTSSTMGNFPLTGDFTGGTLKFEISGGPGEMTFSGSLKDRDTLVGVMSAHNGDLQCVAKRIQK